MRLFCLCLCASSTAAVLLLATRPAMGADGPHWGFRGNEYFSEGPAVAGEYVAHFGPHFSINPNVEQRFSTYANYTSLNADLHFDFTTGGPTVFWVGAGLGAAIQEPKVDELDSEVELATNFLWAVGFRSGSVLPYIQGRVVRTHDTIFSLGFGLRF
jgi:hypothetical protein